jgi:hypothetical protein
MATDEDKRILELAADVRKFEIGLFWQRSLFFWGFIGAAFVAYAALLKGGNTDKNLPLAIACFGFVCSVAWSFANRGSKYWQEYWENEVEQIECKVLRYRLFGKEGRVQTEKNWWLRARRYSVSKLTIALSDFTIMIWLLLIAEVLPWGTFEANKDLSFLMPIVSIFYAGMMLCAGRSTPRKSEPCPPSDLESHAS